MHGRLKVKTTAEQAEAKRLERLKKQKLYQGATARIYAKRAAGDHDEEALKLTRGILSNNPDELTLWNYRKDVFLKLKESRTDEEMIAMYKAELSFLEECLQYNPKSYSSWHQRCFVMLNTPSPDWSWELGLCTKFLSYDERNFHCWDYRRFVIKHSNVSPEDELEFSTEKISNNFSNYSSWHYRSKLLPVIFPGETSQGLQQSTLLEEMELVQNAFFTDPNDQSAWFYHRWLLGRVENPLELLNIDKNNNDRTVLSFSMPVQISSTSVGEGEDVCEWVAPDGQCFSTTWCSDKSTCASMTVSVEFKNKTYTFNLDESTTGPRSMQNYFTHEMTAATNEMLSQELDNCQQLFELEPENKWVLLTIVLLMRCVDPTKYSDSIRDNIQKLSQVDPLRKNYYHDMRSRFTWEDAVSSLDNTVAELSNKSLTRISHIHLMYNITQLDLSNNQLLNLNGVNSLQKLSQLDASNNQICCIKGIHNMPSLVTLNLENNAIKSDEEVEVLRSTCKDLITVTVIGNPCAQTS